MNFSISKPSVFGVCVQKNLFSVVSFLPSGQIGTLRLEKSWLINLGPFDLYHVKIPVSNYRIAQSTTLENKALLVKKIRNSSDGLPLYHQRRGII